MNKNKRIVYLDILRIIAIISVIGIHASVYFKDITNIRSITWQSANVFDCLRFGVPIFFMISGALFLNKEEFSTKDFYIKHIGKILLCYLITSFFYARVYYTDLSIFNILFWKKVLKGYFHLWFCIVIIEIYLITQLLRRLIKNEKMTIYIVIYGIVFGVILPTIYHKHIDSFEIFVPIGYTTYYLIGYLLSKKNIHKLFRYIIYIVGVACLIFTICSSNIISFKINDEWRRVEYLNLNIVLISIAIFLFFKNLTIKTNDNQKTILEELYKLTMGVYLIHPLINDLLFSYGFYLWTIKYQFIGITIYIFFVYLISLIITKGIQKLIDYFKPLFKTDD